MPDPQVQEYIRQSRNSGVLDTEIKNALLQSGWQIADVEENFKTLDGARTSLLLSPLRKSIFLILPVAFLVYAAAAYFAGFWPLQGKKITQQETESLPGATDTTEVQPTPAPSVSIQATPATASFSPTPLKPPPSQEIVTLTPWPPGEKFAHVGEILISFSVTGKTFDGVLLSIGGYVDVINGPGPYQWKINMIELGDEMGRYDIRVLTVNKNTIQGPEVGYEKSTYILRLPEVGLSDLWEYQYRHDDIPLLVFKGEYGRNLRVRGLTVDGVEVGLSHSSAGTTYKTGSGSNSIISVTPDGLVTGNNIGSDTVIIANRYGKKSIVIPIDVEEF